MDRQNRRQTRPLPLKPPREDRLGRTQRVPAPSRNADDADDDEEEGEAVCGEGAAWGVRRSGGWGEARRERTYSMRRRSIWAYFVAGNCDGSSGFGLIK